MELSIHYCGSFNPSSSLKGLSEEVKDIAEIYKWKYHVYIDEFPPNTIGKTEYSQDVYGICFTPPNSETVSLSFLSNGRMSSTAHLKFFGNSENKDDALYLYMLSTKTQYVGIEIHKLIIHLLKYISRKYLLDFKVIDEGEYWETGDEKLLEETFKKYTDLIDGFQSSLENNPMESGESFEEYFARILKQLHDKKKG